MFKMFKFWKGRNTPYEPPFDEPVRTIIYSLTHDWDKWKLMKVSSAFVLRYEDNKFEAYYPMEGPRRLSNSHWLKGSERVAVSNAVNYAIDKIEAKEKAMARQQWMSITDDYKYLKDKNETN